MARTGKVLLSKQSLRYALGFVWLLDGALQLQSFMFTSGSYRAPFFGTPD
jgi:hypothetical protein